MRSRHLGGGLHGSQVAADSRFLLLLDDGGGHGEAGHRLVALHAPASVSAYMALPQAREVLGILLVGINRPR